VGRRKGRVERRELNEGYIDRSGTDRVSGGGEPIGEGTTTEQNDVEKEGYPERPTHDPLVV
jgi:hypothetical protein